MEPEASTCTSGAPVAAHQWEGVRAGESGRGGSPPTAQQPGRQINPASSLPGFRSQTESLTDRGALIFVLQEFCTFLKCQPNAGWNCHNSWGMPTGFDWDSGRDIPPRRRPGPAANMAARKLRTKPGSGNISLPWPRRTLRALAPCMACSCPGLEGQCPGEETERTLHPCSSQTQNYGLLTLRASCSLVLLLHICRQLLYVVLEKTFKSPLDSKEIEPVNPKGNQS